MLYSKHWAQRQTRLAEEESAKVFNRRLQYLIIWLPALAIIGYWLIYQFQVWANTDLPIAI